MHPSLWAQDYHVTRGTMHPSLWAQDYLACHTRELGFSLFQVILFIHKAIKAVNIAWVSGEGGLGIRLREVQILATQAPPSKGFAILFLS